MLSVRIGIIIVGKEQAEKKIRGFGTLKYTQSVLNSFLDTTGINKITIPTLFCSPREAVIGETWDLFVKVMRRGYHVTNNRADVMQILALISLKTSLNLNINSHNCEHLRTPVQFPRLPHLIHYNHSYLVPHNIFSSITTSAIPIMPASTIILRVLYVSQHLYAAYNLYLSQIAIQKLRLYEEMSEKAAKWSNEAERQLHKTRTTQASLAASVRISFFFLETGSVCVSWFEKHNAGFYKLCSSCLAREEP